MFSSVVAQNKTEEIHKNLKLDCKFCHVTESFEKIEFDHLSTGYDLVEKHKFADCKSCHNISDFSKVSENCSSCHTDVHNATLGENCLECHNFRNFNSMNGFRFHDEKTNFELKGAHQILDCKVCHKESNKGIFVGQSNDCISCHLNDFLSAQSPNHVEANYSSDCTICHSTKKRGWRGDNFVHEQFPLAGVHKISDCSNCHTSTNYSEASSDCYSCHKTDFETTQNPNHVQSQFSTNCEICHNTTNFGWKPATFDHSTFPLLGIHALTECTACHVNNIYVGTPRDCFSCHQSEFQNAQNPPHNSFPTDCTACHNLNGWQPATLANHDSEYFPIYSGEHKNVWGNDCSTCHTNPSDFKVFSCFTGCHEHNQNDMEDEHDDVGGYVYESIACYNCHPNGEEDSPSWNRKRGYNEK